MKENIRVYKIKSNIKDHFEHALREIYHPQYRDFRKKKKNNEYIYKVSSINLMDYYNVISSKGPIGPPTGITKKQKKYLDLINKIVLLKQYYPDDNDLVEASIGGKYLKDLKSLFKFFDQHPKIAKYYYNKAAKCITLFILNGKDQLFLMDLFKDRIVEGLCFGIDILNGGFVYDGVITPDVEIRIKEMNRKFNKWKFKKPILTST